VDCISDSNNELCFSILQSKLPYDINKNVLTVTLLLMGVGLGGFLVSIVQFGLDQLHDASTTEIKSFILWYA
jgi:hypothetical protein